MSAADRYRTRLRHARQDLGRSIDYLATRDDIDIERLGWFGVSWGAQAMVPLLAVEKRFRSAVLDGGGIYLLDIPAAEQFFNYLPRINQPVLMLNGRWDIDVPLETQRRFFELLGTPPEDKRHVLFEAGHGALPHNQLVRATLELVRQVPGADAPVMGTFSISASARRDLATNDEMENVPITGPGTRQRGRSGPACRANPASSSPTGSASSRARRAHRRAAAPTRAPRA